MVSFIRTRICFRAAVFSKFTQSLHKAKTRRSVRGCFLVNLWGFRLLDCGFTPNFHVQKIGFFNAPNVVQMFKTGGF